MLTDLWHALQRVVRAIGRHLTNVGADLNGISPAALRFNNGTPSPTPAGIWDALDQQNDLRIWAAKVAASKTSGLSVWDVIPSEDDYRLADEFGRRISRGLWDD